jgi:DNA-directed RNA polymerase subunit A"
MILILLKEVMIKMKKTKSDIPPFEAVGVIAAQSVGEPGTQMSTANDEIVLVNEQNKIRTIEIGKFVDKLIEKYGSIDIDKSKVCDLPKNVEIKVPSLTENGKVKWKRLVSCSRHKCDKPLLEIVLRSGRRIRTTDNHSFVIRKNNNIIPIKGSKLKLGERLPVVRNLSAPIHLETLNLEEYLPKIKFIYGSEINKVRMHQDFEFGKDLIIPSSQERLQIYSADSQIELDYIYQYPLRKTSKRIPKVLELDTLFGWFVGAYLSEGSLAKTMIGISNIDPDFQENVRAVSKKFCLNLRENDHHRGFAHGHDMYMCSSIISTILKKTCGKGSFNKRVPEFAFSASEDIIASILRGYFDGDGNVSVERRMMRAHSRSKELRDGIVLLLTRLGIFAKKHVENGTYVLTISHRYAKTFKEKIGFDIKRKANALDKLCNVKDKEIHYDIVEMIVGFGTLLKDVAKKLNLYKREDAFSVGIRKFTRKQKIGKQTLRKYIKLFSSSAQKKKINIDSELSILRGYLEEDVIWDEIIEINEYVPENKFVYDFSVPGLETFTTLDGIITHNTMRTFHYAGVAEHVPTGLPRLIEIVDAKREPKKPIIDIYLKKSISKKESDAAKIAKELSSVFVSDVATIEDDLEDLSVVIEYNEKDGKALGVTLNKLKSELEEHSSKLKISGNTIKLYSKKIKAKEGENAKPVTARSVRKLGNKIHDTLLKGVKGIHRAVVVKGDGEYFIRAAGFNITGATEHPSVDPNRVYTNNIKEIERIFGIEAARNAILKEMKDVMDMQRLYVDIRHIMLIADAMTNSGVIKSIGRHGLSGGKVGVLGRAAFEETVKHLVNAAASAEDEKLVGVTENIIVGQTVPVGTGKIKLVMKTNKK